MSRFKTVDRDTAYLPPPPVDEWLPDDHLARSVVEVVEQLDLSELTRQYAGRGSAAQHPSVLLGLLIDGHASEVHPSRKIERASDDTLANFRRRFLKRVETLSWAHANKTEAPLRQEASRVREIRVHGVSGGVGSLTGLRAT